MGLLAFDVAEEALDPGLVGGGAGPAVVLGDRDGGHEGAVSVEIMGPPLSDTASRIGRRGSSRGGSRRSSVNKSMRPSTARASSNTTRTWVQDSSDDTTVEIWRRLTMSTMANTQRRARPKWVTSHIQIRLGSHTSHGGHGRFGSRRRGGAWATMSPFASRTRLNVDGDTHTEFS